MRWRACVVRAERLPAAPGPDPASSAGGCRPWARRMAWHQDSVADAGARIRSGLGMQPTSMAIKAPTRTIAAGRDEPPARDDARRPACTVMILSARSAGGAPNRSLWVPEGNGGDGLRWAGLPLVAGDLPGFRTGRAPRTGAGACTGASARATMIGRAQIERPVRPAPRPGQPGDLLAGRAAAVGGENLGFHRTPPPLDVADIACLAY